MSLDFTGQDDKGAEDDVSLYMSTGLLALG